MSSLEVEEGAAYPSKTIDNAGALFDRDNKEFSRWYVQVSIGGAKLRALYDTGACRTFIVSVGIQMSTMYGREIHLYPRKMKSSNGTLSEITGLVDLPFEIGGIWKEVTVCIPPLLTVTATWEPIGFASLVPTAAKYNFKLGIICDIS